MNKRKLFFAGMAVLAIAAIGIAVASKYVSNNELAQVNEIVPSTPPTPAPSSAQENNIAVPILIYHSIAPHRPWESRIVLHYTVTPDAFGRQLKYLADYHYNVITFATLVNMATHDIPFPPKSVVITFDDGWEDQYRDAFPILKKYHDAATFFIFTNGPGSKDFLSWNQIKEMSDAGMDIESHSVSHPYLFRITDTKTLWHEIADSKKIIENHIGKPVTLFAYPFGYYNNLDIAMLEKDGYTAARTDILGKHPNTKNNLFTLDGVEVASDFGKFVKDLQ